MELHCFPRVECRNGSRTRRRVGEGLLLLLPLLFSSSFPPVSGQTRKIYFLGVGGGGGEGTGGESRHHPPTHEYQERLTNYRVKYCNLLMGEMRDSGKETGPHRSFVLHHVLRLSSNLRFPSRRLPARSLSPPTPCPPPDCPLFINAIKETECRASTVGFLPCRCREPAVTLGENIRREADSPLVEAERVVDTQFASRKFDVPSISNPPFLSLRCPSTLYIKRTTSIHDFYAKYVFFSSPRATKTYTSHILYRDER